MCDSKSSRQSTTVTRQSLRDRMISDFRSNADDSLSQLGTTFSALSPDEQRSLARQTATVTSEMFRQAIASVECTSSGDVERRTVLQRELGDFNVTDELIDAMIQGCGSEKGTVTPLPSDIDGVNDNHKAREGDKSGKSGTSQLAASDATLTPGQVLAKQHSIYCTKV